jgi:hypothetical protein
MNYIHNLDEKKCNNLSINEALLIHILAICLLDNVNTLHMFCFLTYLHIIIKNLHILYTEKSTSLSIKTLTLHKY